MALSREYQQRLADWVKWYNYHRKNASMGGVETRLQFTEKALNGALHLIAGLADEIQANAGVPPERKLWLPVDVRW